MGNINFAQVIVGLLVLSAVALIYIFLSNKNNSKSGNSNMETAPITSTVEDNQTDSEDLSNDSLIAVLTAAVMAMQSNPDIKIRVTSFRRIPQSSPVWNTIGRRERMESKL